MRLLALIAAVALPALLVAAPVPKEKGKTDDDRILGTWAVEKFSWGPPVGPTADELARMRVVFETGNTMTLVGWPGGEGSGEKMPYKLDPDADVKRLDLTDGEHTAMRCVYELDGDTLKLCLPTEKKSERPAAVKAGDGQVLITLKRVTDGKKGEPK